MTAYQAELGIDLGEVGYAKRKEPFRVRLNARPVAELIAQAKNAHRVYELMLIDRPGDVWDYVSVTVDDTSPHLRARVEHVREQAMARFIDEHSCPDRGVPFPTFDRLFQWMSDDTEPEDEAWLNHRESETMRAFAQQLLAMVRAAQRDVDWNDHLLRHVVARARSGEHPYAFLDRGAAIKKGREKSPGAPSHSAGFYQQLAALLRDPALTSVTYRADGDHGVLRMMATEQRRRASRTGHAAGQALHESALVNRTISNEAWDSEIWFFEEGLAHGDLFIQGTGLGEKGARGLVRMHGRVPGRYILSSQDEGEIAGFDAEAGDGWVLYRNQEPDSRRVGLERTESRCRSKLGPVLKFGGPGTTLFDHDKAVVVVGHAVQGPARAALAVALAEWQQHGGEPALVVLGDARPFELAGCRGILRPAEPLIDADNESAQARLRQTLQCVQPWIDAIVALDAPPWATQVLAEQARDVEGLWAPWIVATRGVEHLHIDVALEGDLTLVLREARERARATRPQVL